MSSESSSPGREAPVGGGSSAASRASAGDLSSVGDEARAGAAASSGAGSCPYAWCTTDHGATVHPDDEVHRSAGAAVEIRVRRADDHAPGAPATVEVGLLRRPDDTETWLVIDDGAAVSLAMTLEGARRLREACDRDPLLRAALEG